MTTTEYPPFAPGGPSLPNQLGQGEKKRTGHIFADCALYGLPPAKGKVVACEDCVLRYRITAAEARAHQAAFDAAWRSERVEMTTVGHGKPYEYEVPREEPRVDRFEAESYEPVAPRAKAVRSNKFAGACSLCGGRVAAGEGSLSGGPGAWVTTHLPGACQAPTATPEATVAEPLRAGAYRLADGRVIRVQMSKPKGNPYAVALDAARTYLGGGRLLAGAVRLSVEEAKVYGRETGTCCVCGAHLENPESVALGIGPVCGGRQ